MILSLIMMLFLAVTSAWTEAPNGRWEGTITYDSLNVPFVIHFESNGKGLTGSFVNGDNRLSSTEGSFENGVVRLTFGTSGTRLEATLVDGELNGTYGSGGQDKHSLIASKFCECNFQGEPGPDISGNWAVEDSNLRLRIKRVGEDSLVTVSRPSGDLGPITGRSDGLTFMLHYFDGVRGAVLEIEQRKDGGLDLKFTEAGTNVKKYRAVKVTIP